MIQRFCVRLFLNYVLGKCKHATVSVTEMALTPVSSWVAYYLNVGNTFDCIEATAGALRLSNGNSLQWGWLLVD